LKIIGSSLALVSTFFISIVGMVQGWGIQPVSWGWIIGCYLACMFTTLLAHVLGDQ
jgi:hypothetical protein